MSARSAAALAVQDVPKGGAGLLLAVAAAIVSPFDCVLAGMIRAGLGVEAVCAYLGLSRAALDHNLIRLDLPTPHDKPRRKGGQRAWSDQELRCAIYWRRLGIHPESIGCALGRTATAVRSKMHRLGVPAPDRKALHRVDPGTLDRTSPDLGFPAPPTENAHAGGTSQASDNVSNKLVVFPGTANVPRQSDAAGSVENAGSKGRKAPVTGQRELRLLGVVSNANLEVLEAAGTTSVDEKPATAPLPELVCRPVEACETPKPEVIGSCELIQRYQVTAKVRRPDTNKEFLTWVALLYLGGMHFRAISAYFGGSLSPDAVQSILNRMQMPRDGSRGKFGWTCDLECAVANLEMWGFSLTRCTDNPSLPDGEKPWFWRHKSDKGIRRRRCARLKNNEIQDVFKYKDGNRYTILTREQLEEAGFLKGGSKPIQKPSRLQASMQGSLPIQQGAAANEQFAFCRHAPVVRPGLSGNPCDEMPWAYPGDGSATRPVAHP